MIERELRISRGDRSVTLDADAMPKVFYVRAPDGATERIYKVHYDLFRCRIVKKVPKNVLVIDLKELE